MKKVFNTKQLFKTLFEILETNRLKKYSIKYRN